MLRCMRKLIGYFAQGALIFGPVAATLLLVWFVFQKIDSLLGFDVPGIGLVVTFLLFAGLGFLASNVIGARVVNILDEAFKKLPLVRLLYNSFKDFIAAFVGERAAFSIPVSVEVQGIGLVLGFITRDSVPLPDLEDHVAVYFPQSYNVAGALIMVPRARVRRLDVSSSELMTFGVSGGVSGFGAARSRNASAPGG